MGEPTPGKYATAGYAFTGREWDPETGSTTTGLDTTIRRWGDSQQKIPFATERKNDNLYGYVRNAPVRLSDPSGQNAAALVIPAAIGDPEPFTKAVLIVLACGIAIVMVIQMAKNRSSKTCFCFDTEPYSQGPFGKQFGGNKYGDCTSDYDCNRKCEGKGYAFGRCYDK